MTEPEIKYDQLKQAVTKMLNAQAEARKNKTVQQKWLVANKLEREVKELINPTEKSVSQGALEWLAK